MTTKEAIDEIYKSGHNASFQTCLNANPFASEEVYVNVNKEEPGSVTGRILKKFGEQDWVRLDFKGYISCYCPVEISEQLKREKNRMFNEFARYGCD